MRELFPGHFKENEDALRTLWDDGIIIFDANILLNLYRYSEQTRSDFIRVMQELRNQLWLPNRAVEEFLENRNNVLEAQIDSYDSVIRQIESLEKTLENSRQHPFIKESLFKKSINLFGQLNAELNKNKEAHQQLIHDDPIKEVLATIFEGRVGTGFSKENLKVIMEAAQDRYAEKIPPGYKDYSSKRVGDEAPLKARLRPFGDYLLWEQILNYAEANAKSVILVTDDRKEDWWETLKGKTIGPRPELVAEFKERVNMTFHMYQADRFLGRAKEKLDEKISEASLKEIRELRSNKLKQRYEESLFHSMLESKREQYFAQHENIKDVLINNEMEKLRLSEQLSALKEDQRESESAIEKTGLEDQIQQVEEQLKVLTSRSEKLKKQLIKATENRMALESKSTFGRHGSKRFIYNFNGVDDLE